MLFHPLAPAPREGSIPVWRSPGQPMVPAAPSRQPRAQASPTMHSPGVWNVLSETQIERMRSAAFAFMEDTGFVFQHPVLLRKARAAGAKVDEASGRVRLDRALTRELIAQAPARYAIRNLLGREWEVGGPAGHATAIVTDPWVIDYASGRPRRPCLEDLRRHTIVAQRLDCVTTISRMDYPVTDFADGTSSLRALEAHLLNHAKHYCVMPTSLESFEQWIGISRVLARGGDIRGLATAGVAVASPLTLNPMNAEILLRAVETGCIAYSTVCPMAGSTAPYSLAGCLLQAHIEALLIVVAAQLLRPGAPVLYGTGLSLTDLRDGHDLYYTLDKVLWKIGGGQLGNAEHLPVLGECGGSMTYRYDQQSGAEGMLFMLAALASGSHVLSGIGSCHNAIGMSAEMMVIQDAYLKAARFLGRGINTDDVHLALPSLRRAGPGDMFLDDDLTIELMRSDEFFSSDIFDYSGGRPQGRSLLERAHSRVEELVAGFTSPVPGEVQESLRAHFRRLYAAGGAA